MNVTFTPVAPVPPSEERVVVGGVDVGKIVKNQKHADDYYALFELPIRECLLTNLVQGHGRTKHEAIMDGIMRSRRGARELLQKLDELEAKLFGSASAKGGAA